MYIMSIFFFFFFLKKILLFNLGNKILSLVVHWGMKVMDMTKKNLRSESYIDRRAKESRQLILLSFVFSVSKIKNFKNFQKLKQFARKGTIKK